MAAWGVGARLTRPPRRADLRRVLAAVRDGSLALVEDVDATEPVRGASVALPERGRVLLAEDNEVNQQVVVAMLEALGCRVDVAPDGRTALEMLERGPYDLVFMDCQMPVLDGFAATRRIREIEAASAREGGSRPHVPIVALTAHANDDHRDECLAAGMDDYLSKPFFKADLCQMLDRWLAPSGDLARTAAPERRADSGRPPGDREPRLDPTALDGLRSVARGDPEVLVARLVHTYLLSSTGVVEKLREAVGANDLKGAARAAHRLKSSSAQVGAQRLSQLCKELECRCRSGELDGLAEFADAVEGELTAVQEALSVERFGVRDE